MENDFYVFQNGLCVSKIFEIFVVFLFIPDFKDTHREKAP